ncbi:unnamed protein product [Closterium sp. NIES-53]
MWHDDLQLYILSDSNDSVSLFDHVSGATQAPSATTDSSTRSQWLSRGATARLAIRNHLPVIECAHFGDHRTAHALYDVVVARYSSPVTAALGRLLLPYLLPELSAFATVADLVTHLRSRDARYRAALPAEFLAGNLPPMYITLYFVVTRLPDSLRSVRDHFLTLNPTSLTVDLLEQHLIAAETSAVATSLLLRTSVSLRLVRSAAAARARVAGVVEEAAEVVEVAVGAVVGAAVEVVEVVEVVAAVGLVAAVGALVVAVEAAEGLAAVEAVGLVVVGLDLGMEALVVVGASSSSVAARPSRPSSSTCGRLHTKICCFARLDDAWRAEFGDDVERPRWAELLRSGVAIFDLDYDAILSAMYALSFNAEGDCYWCVPPDLGIAAAAQGASVSGTPPGTAPAEALHTFTLDSGASRCFFGDSTTLTPLRAPVPVRLADPSGGLVVARSSTVLPCPAVLSGSLSGLHIPSFSTNLVSTAALQDAMVTTTTPGGSSLYTRATEPPQVAASAQVSASGQVAASCSCRLLSHQTLLWHRRLGHPSQPRLRGMYSRLLGPARVSGQGRECYFLLVVDDYTRYTTVFPLRTKGGEFSSDLLRDFFRGEGILQSFTLPDSPQQNGIAECCIGLVMEVARTSMIHAAAPHFLRLFAVQYCQSGWDSIKYAAHQLNLWPCVSLPETSPTLRWTGKVGDASLFRVWGSRAFVRDMSADKLFARAIPCVFLVFVPDAPGWQFYHPTLCLVLRSQDVTFDESVPFYRLFVYRSAPPPPPPLFLAPAVGSGAAPGAASGGAASGGAASGGAELGGAGSGGAEPGGAEP